MLMRSHGIETCSVRRTRRNDRRTGIVLMMGYEITSIEDNWIFIKHDYRDELDGFIMLMKSIEGELGGRIIQMDGEDIQYTIQNDPFGLIFRWDVQSGTAVIVPDSVNIDAVVSMLESHFERLNN